MKAYIQFELKLFIKNPKNRIMFLVYAGLLLTISFFIFFRDAGNIEHTQYLQMNQNRIAISTLSANVVEDPEYSGFYSKLYDQQQLVASQDVAVRFEEDSWFVDAGLNLSQLQIEMHEFDELDNLDDEVRAIVPSLHQAETNQVYLTYIDEHAIPLLRDHKHAAGFLITFFESFGLVAFVFLLLFTGSILSRDMEHTTMVKGYPLSYELKTGSKILIYTAASFLSISLLTLVFAGMTALVTDMGPLQYPVVLYQENQYTAVTLSAYAIRYSLYVLVMAIHVSAFSALLNTLTKSMYATLFTGLFLYFIPFLVNIESFIWRWIPLQYYRVSTVMSGESAFQTGQNQLTYTSGIIVLLIWSMVFVGLVYGVQYLLGRQNKIESTTLIKNTA